ncbi:exodeoxyribonuclease V subunit beta [Buchnera aphidicola]|uniref:RecBCD enzyme subunit RecB n=1 Tax=Buchnera aphidicola (Cinara cf. splendens/pseudotsugae 3390) TaxID=2518980 RepID=A0A451CXM4_9GAMM|nr:exodeoxyribonuclease V subunit beta [Buchnera aphidicola]VFP77867.1 RecBCD enzyme subunit RecB [Buchnera aphidicola (Cinara cf. splendens/pseudotsugae 3390)]
MKYISLDMKKIPDHGITLIEASAGTGKTFSIVTLYLRLLLNLGIKNTYKRPLSIYEILVVTFTEASKNDLKKRLYKKVCQLHADCINTDSKKSELIDIVKDIKDIKKTTKLLQFAKKNINSIMIYTLHGFFLNTLYEQKFLCNQVIPIKILKNIEKIKLEATKDFWRNNVYEINEHITYLIIKKWPTPKKLFKYINILLNQKKTKVHYSFSKKTNLKKQYDNIIKKINKTKKFWKKNKHEIQKSIIHTNINKTKSKHEKLKKWFYQIDHWSVKITNNCIIPKILKNIQFCKILSNQLIKKNSQYILFKKIKKIFTSYNLFFKYFIFMALKKIPQIIQKKKKKKKGLEFDDLNKIMLKQIKLKSSTIKKNIIKKNTVTIIDECQDIDNIQFNIFYELYNNVHNKSLILFGDPKQSIYSFRGANIFLYLKIKKKINKCFILEKNFRSSKNMVTGINNLFSRIQAPFIWKNINFNKSSSYSKNKKIYFSINKIKQSAFNLIVKYDVEMNTDEYYSWISKECANSIYNWLSDKLNKKSILKLRNQKKRCIQPKDIAILVKNKYEASLIKQELHKKNINSIYTSRKKNIFHTTEAQELMLIMDAIIDLSNKLKFKKLLMTKIFNISINNIQLINNQIHTYFYLLKKLKKYYTIWNTINISQMIAKIIVDFNLLKRNTLTQKNNINIQNITTICKILEKKNQSITNKFLLITWLKKKILQKDIDNSNVIYTETVNSIEYAKSIKIITIHKSKGLEYPIIWIPFFSKLQIKKSNSISSKHILSEDLRLLYVAITRSIVHCNIGLAVISKRKKKKTSYKNYTNFHKSSLGFLIQKGKKSSLLKLKEELYKLQNPEIFQIKYTCKIKETIYKKKIIQRNDPVYLNVLKNTINPWNKISFSKIVKKNLFYKKKYILSIFQKKKSTLKKNQYIFCKNNIHQFPRGKEYGLYLHKVFKKINFKNTTKTKKILNQLNYLSLSEKWINKLYTWICNFISKPLHKNCLILNQLKNTEYQKEVKFTVPIEKTINIKKFNSIINNFDPLSKKCTNINFENVSGVLTGVIDLIFLWKKKYYIIDYKSNWLGPNYTYYTQKNFQNEIIKYRYDIQYQLYSLAMHRYLKLKIKDYDYKIHFGGIFYLFVRAFDEKNDSRVYFIKPDYLLIHNLDNLLYGKLYDTSK